MVLMKNSSYYGVSPLNIQRELCGPNNYVLVLLTPLTQENSKGERERDNRDERGKRKEENKLTCSRFVSSFTEFRYLSLIILLSYRL
jgi:hypothetical protein